MSTLRTDTDPLDVAVDDGRLPDPAQHDRMILAEDSDVGGDGDAPGIAQPITQAEIDDLLNDPALTIEEKQATLQRYADQVGARDDIDRGGDMSPLEMQIGEALYALGYTRATMAVTVGSNPARVS